MISSRLAVVLPGFLLLLPALAAGQQAEVRADMLGPRPYSVQPGAGLVVPLGVYARLSGNLGYALEPRADLAGNRWRADVLARFVLDPFRQQRWGLSVGGGLSFRRHTYIAAIADLEGPAMGGFVPAVQLGFSGGVRAAMILRRAMSARR